MVIPLTKSVLSPSAPTNKLCYVGVTPESRLKGLRSVLGANKPVLGNYYYLFMLMLDGGSRISETLLIRSRHISSSGHVYIEASKGSENRLICSAECVEWLLRRKGVSDVVFVGMNRFSAYRLLKNIGVGKLKKGRLNNSVTHIFKDEFTKEMRGLEPDANKLSKLTGHKVAKNTEFYGRD